MPCTLDGYGPETASLRFRCEYVAKYWPDADVYPKMRQAWDRYDVYIFQKAYLSEKSKILLKCCSARPDALVAFDMCDADWTQGDRHLRALVDALSKCDFAVTPNRAICDWLAQWTPASVIPDRLDLTDFTETHYAQYDPPRLVWFGYSHNLGAIEPFWTLIAERGLELTILSNECPRPWNTRRGVRFVRWTRDGANSVIAAHCLALVTPASPYKSDNRLITALALGVPTVSDIAEWNQFFNLDLASRELVASRGQAWARQMGDVRQSVVDWRKLIDIACEHKRNGVGI